MCRKIKKSAKFIERTETVNNISNTVGYARVHDQSTVDKEALIENWTKVVQDPY